jgi:hypothetical protein
MITLDEIKSILKQQPLLSKQPGRLVYYSEVRTPIANPWIGLHDGSITNAVDLAKWELIIPQYGCPCKRFYADWKAENAPDFSSPEAFFAWGVRLHNAVNDKLGKPQITIDEAYSIWRSSDARKSENSGTIVP